MVDRYDDASNALDNVPVETVTTAVCVPSQNCELLELIMDIAATTLTRYSKKYRKSSEIQQKM